MKELHKENQQLKRELKQTKEEMQWLFFDATAIRKQLQNEFDSFK